MKQLNRLAWLAAILCSFSGHAQGLHDIVTKGATDRSVTVKILDSATGVPSTDIVFNSSGIDLWYRREGAASVDVTEATLAALTTAHTDGGFLHVNDGVYRLDLPDAAFATGANYVDFGGTVTGEIVIGGRVKLVNANLEDSVRLGLTALPNAAADAAGGLPISDAGGLDLDALNTNVNDIETDTGTTLQAELDGIETATDAILADTGTDGVVVAAGSKSGYALSQAGLADFFDTDTGTDYDSAVAGSVVAETADNAGGSALTVADINAGAGILTTTIATLASQTSFTLTAGSGDDDAYNGWAAFIRDASTATQVALGIVEDYTGSSKTVTLAADPGVFTMATSDNIMLLPAFMTTGVDVTTIEGTDATDQVRDALVDDATRIDASALNTASGTTIPAIVADTNEVQVTLAAGGTIESLVDDLPALTTAVADLPTNSELATSQAAADDATLSAIAALNDLSAADVRDLVIEDQGSGVSLGCAIAVVLAYAAGDLTTAGGDSTYEDPSGTETRATGTVASAGNRTVAITCPSY